MKKLVMLCILATFGTLPVAAGATDINLLGKVTSTITATVSAKQNLVVTSDTGGWFDQGLEMLQSGGWDTPYTVQARLKIVSPSGIFKCAWMSPCRYVTPVMRRKSSCIQK